MMARRVGPLQPKKKSPTRVAVDLKAAEQAAFLSTILESSTEYSIIAKDMTGVFFF